MRYRKVLKEPVDSLSVLTPDLCIQDKDFVLLDLQQVSDTVAIRA